MLVYFLYRKCCVRYWEIERYKVGSLLSQNEQEKQGNSHLGQRTKEREGVASRAQSQKLSVRWGCGLVIKHRLGLYKDPGSIPNLKQSKTQVVSCGRVAAYLGSVAY